MLILLFVSGYCKTIAFLRHGIRSPNDYNDLDKQLWGNFPPGYLTEKGFQQVRDMANQHYKTDDYCDYESFRMVASVKPRVMHSVTAFITGLCPLNYEEIIRQFFIDYYHQYSTDETNYQNIIDSNFSEPLLLNFSTFTIPQDFLFHGIDQCKSINFILDAIYSSDEYEEINLQFKNEIEFESILTLYQQCYPLANQTKETITFTQIKKLYSAILCNEAEGIFNYNLTNNEIQYLMKIFKMQWYGIELHQPLQHSASLNNIIQWIYSEIYDTTSQYSFYYGHDSNQYALLSVITNSYNYVKFASRLEFVIENNIVNVYLDDEQIITKFCNSGINCTLDEALQFLKKFIDKQLFKHCAI